MLKTIEQFVHIAKAIGDDDDHRALANALGKLVQLGDQPRLPARLGGCEGLEDVLEVQRIAPGREGYSEKYLKRRRRTF